MSDIGNEVRRRLAPLIAQSKIGPPIITTSEGLAGTEPVTVVTVPSLPGQPPSPRVRDEVSRVLSDLGRNVIVGHA